MEIMKNSIDREEGKIAQTCKTDNRTCEMTKANKISQCVRIVEATPKNIIKGKKRTGADQHRN